MSFDIDEEFDFDQQPFENGLYQLPNSFSEPRLQSYVSEKRGKFWIDLDIPEVQAVLCQRLRAVSSIEGARQWKLSFGSLWAVTNAEKTLKLAETIRWIYKLYDLLTWAQTPLLRKHYCAESVLGRAMAKMTEDEYDFNAARIAAGEKVSSDELMKTLAVLLNWERPERGTIIFSPNGVYETPVYHLSTAFGGLTDGMISEIFPHYLEQEVKDTEKAKEDDHIILSLAHKYFEILINQQIQCIQLAVTPVETDSVIRLQQTFAARFPWQAILSAMLKDVTGGPAPRKCANPTCTEFFVAKKSHQLFCARPGCRKAASRRKASQ